MDESFVEREKLLRAVWPPNRRPDFWINGRLSSAALKDKRGLSVDRTFDRPLKTAIESMRTRLGGYIVSFPVPLCNFAQVYLRYLPSNGNPYHSEMHRSETEVILSDEQALLLARAATLEYEPNYEYKV